MSLRVNTNVEAFDAHRNLEQHAVRARKSMQKLSSGLRINSAADDAAGLAISEKMRARSTAPTRPSATRWTASRSSRPQKAPTTRCTRSCSASASSSVQAQNGTLSTSDTAAIDQEVGQLTAELVAHLRQHRSSTACSILSGTFTLQVGADQGSGNQISFSLTRDQLLGPSAAPRRRPRSPTSTPPSRASRTPAPPSARSRTGSRTPSTTSASTRRTSPPPEPHPRRRRRRGDGQLHEAADPLPVRHRDARPGELRTAERALAAQGLASQAPMAPPSRQRTARHEGPRLVRGPSCLCNVSQRARMSSGAYPPRPKHGLRPTDIKSRGRPGVAPGQSAPRRGSSPPGRRARTSRRMQCLSDQHQHRGAQRASAARRAPSTSSARACRSCRPACASTAPPTTPPASRSPRR